MDNNARVKIQVDDSRVKELRQGASELYERFARNAKQQSKDIRDINRSIEEQIRLLEIRNQKQNILRRQELEAERRSGNVTPREYQRNLRNLDASRDLATAQIGNLREMLASDNIIPKQREQAQEIFDRLSQEATQGRGNIGTELENRITQFERQRSLEQSGRAFRLRSRFDQGYMTRQQYGSELRSLQADKQNDTLLVKLLREIADNTKNDAKNSAEELVRRLGISSKSDASKWIENLEGKRTGSATDILRRQEAANIIRRQYGIGGGPGSGMGGDFSSLPMMAFNGMGGGMGASIIRTLSKAGPLLPIAVLGGLGLGAWNRFSDVVRGGRDYAAINNDRDLSGVWATAMGRGDAGGLRLGMTAEDMLNRGIAYQRATGRKPSNDEIVNNFAQQRVLGLGDSDYMSMLSLGRFSRGGTAQGAMGALANITNRRFGNLALLPEMINTFQSAAQGILGVRGDFDQNALAGIINGLSNGTGAQGAQLNRIVSSFQNIGNNSNPLATSLAYRAAMMTNPDLTTWEAGKMIENPLGNTDFLRQYLKQIQEASGGGDNAKYLAKSLLGLSFDDIDKLFGAKGDRDFDKIVRSMRTGGGADYRDAGAGLTTNQEQLKAYGQYVKDLAVDFMKEMTEYNRAEIEARGELIDRIDKCIDKADNLLEKAALSVTRANLSNPYIFSK